MLNFSISLQRELAILHSTREEIDVMQLIYAHLFYKPVLFEVIACLMCKTCDYKFPKHLGDSFRISQCICPLKP